MKTIAAIKIQKNFKRFFIRRKHKDILLTKTRARQHKEMLSRQSLLVKERNIKRNAVKIIEQHWTKYKEKLKLRALRKHLLTLPYECRLLYIKFKQVKQDADNLRNDVDMMIAKKQGKIS